MTNRDLRICLALLHLSAGLFFALLVAVGLPNPSVPYLALVAIGSLCAAYSIFQHRPWSFLAQIAVLVSLIPMWKKVYHQDPPFPFVDYTYALLMILVVPAVALLGMVSMAVVAFLWGQTEGKDIQDSPSWQIGEFAVIAAISALLIWQLDFVIPAAGHEAHRRQQEEWNAAQIKAAEELDEKLRHREKERPNGPLKK